MTKRPKLEPEGGLASRKPPAPPPPPDAAPAARAKSRDLPREPFAAFLEALRAGGVEDFQDLSTWSAWLVLCKALTGAKLTPDELVVFRRHTGRTRVLPRFEECLAIVGRQSGKSRIATALASYIAALSKRSQTVRAVSLVSQDHSAAKSVLLSYFRSLFAHHAGLRGLVAKQKEGEIVLKNNHVLRTFPCDPAAVRGPRNRVAIVDEIGFLRSREGVPMALPMLRALRPNSDLVISLTSSMVEGSPVDKLAEEHYGKDDSPILVWKSDTFAMNPTYDRIKSGAIEAADPQGYEEEFLGVALKKSARFLEREAVLACVDAQVFERPPLRGMTYLIALDPSARQEDSYVVTVWHAEKDQYGAVAVQDHLRVFAPVRKGADPDLKGIAGYIKFLRLTYPGGAPVVYSDAAAFHFVASDLAPEIRVLAPKLPGPASDLPGSYDPTANLVRSTTSAALERARTAILQGRVRFVNNPQQTAEWCALQLKRSPSGSVRVEAPSGMHDDIPAADAIAISQLVGASTMPRPAAMGVANPHVPSYPMSAGPSAGWARTHRSDPEAKYLREEIAADKLRRYLDATARVQAGTPEEGDQDLVDVFAKKPRRPGAPYGRAVGPVRRRHGDWVPKEWTNGL